MNILIIITSVLMFLVGIAKLLKAKPMVEQFEEFGLKFPIVMFVGGFEILLSIALYIEEITFYVSLLIFFVMIGAIYNHYKVKHKIAMYLPAFIMLLLSLIISIYSF